MNSLNLLCLIVPVDVIGATACLRGRCSNLEVQEGVWPSEQKRKASPHDWSALHLDNIMPCLY